jgi:hypothetical protein
MAQLGINVQQVTAAIQSQNQAFGIGQIGAPPARPGTEQQFVVTAQGLLTKPEEFENIIVRATREGVAAVRIRDIGRVELAKRDYSLQSRMNGKTATTIGIYQQPGANAVATAKAVRARMEELKAKFPTGLDYKIVLDTSQFTLYSIDKVVHTFFEAVLLVVLVVFVFLQTLRATVIPILAVPVSIIGTFVGMHLLGFSDQHADDVRHDPGDRPGGGRRHRGGRERRGEHHAEGPRAAGGAEAGDDRDRRRADLDRAGAAGGVPAGRLPRRRDRHAVQAVRGHHRHLDGDLRDHGAHALARRSPPSSSRPTTARRTGSSRRSTRVSSACARATWPAPRAWCAPGRCR